MKFIVGLIFLLNITTAEANPQSVIWYTHGAGEQVNINVELFMSSTCPHCIKADAFFREIEKKNPWLIVHRFIINQDKAALETFYEQLQQQHLNDFSVPTIFFCGSRWTGFGDANTTGKLLLHALNDCHDKISQQGELSPSTISVMQKEGAATQFHFDRSMAQSDAQLIMFTALMDTITSCSFFCFAAFLAFLWLFPTDKWLQFRVGLIFLLSLGIIHFVQQAHSDLYYQLLPKLRFAEGLVGAVLLLAALSMYRKSKDPVVLKPGLVIFPVIFFTVCAVYVAQQTCVFNSAVILEQWWAEHTISPIKQLFYQLLYQVFYLLPLVILLLFFLVFGRFRRLRTYQQMLINAGILVLVSIGIILLVYPSLLANLVVSNVVLFASIVVGWLIKRYRVRYE
jgi:glutaredoxin